MLRRTLATATAALGLAGCLEPPDNDVLQFEDGFETCELCDWNTSGDVTRVTTYHPGEHALRLGPGASASHWVNIERGADGDQWTSDDGNWVELSTDCAGPGALDLVPYPTGGLIIAITLDDRALDRFTRHWLNFPPLAPEVPHRFDTLALTATGLPCRVDNVQVRISGGTYAY